MSDNLVGMGEQTIRHMNVIDNLSGTIMNMIKKRSSIHLSCRGCVELFSLEKFRHSLRSIPNIYSLVLMLNPYFTIKFIYATGYSCIRLMLFQ